MRLPGFTAEEALTDSTSATSMYGYRLRRHTADASSVIPQGLVSCTLCCEGRTGFGACLARCLDDGKCCDSGVRNCRVP